MRDTLLLIPAMQAALRLGISRRTLRRHIRAGLVRSVTVSTRTYIPQGEIERIVKGERAPSKPQSQNEISSDATNADNAGQSRELTPDERFHLIFEDNDWRPGFEGKIAECEREEQRDREELEQDVSAGNPGAIAAKAAWDGLENMPTWEWREWPLSPERQRALEVHRATWRTWRQARKARQACNSRAMVLITS
jgi:hypothetical protein